MIYIRYLPNCGTFKMTHICVLLFKSRLFVRLDSRVLKDNVHKDVLQICHWHIFVTEHPIPEWRKQKPNFNMNKHSDEFTVYENKLKKTRISCRSESARLPGRRSRRKEWPYARPELEEFFNDYQKIFTKICRSS